MEVKRKKGIYWKLLLSGLATLYIAGNSFVNNWHTSRDYRVPILIFLGLLLLFSFFMLINAIKNLLKNDPALVLNEEGIVDNVTVLQLGLIPWDKIVACEIKRVQRTDHLIVGLKDYSDHAYLESNFKKSAALQIEKKHDTPFIINSKTIDISLGELKQLIEAKLPNDQLKEQENKEPKNE